MEIKLINVNKSRVHNLKNVSVEIPKNTLTVITGPSGSGKSSLAFDTIYVEGQRRYIESLSSYARQFLGQHQPPDVDSITGLSPSIAIDQKTSSRNPRSTVGTVTEIYDYLRILFARIGTLYCPDSGLEVRSYSPSQITKEVLKLPANSKVHLLAPVEIKNDQDSSLVIGNYLAQGFTRARYKNEIQPIEELKLKKNTTHNFEIVIDRLIVKENIASRVTDSVELGLKYGQGRIIILSETISKESEQLFSQFNVSPKTQRSFPPLEPRLFSFNSPIGACPHCNGLGEMKVFNKDLIVFDPFLSILDGAIGPLSKRNSFMYKMVICVAEQEKVDIEKPFNKLPKKFIDILFNGTEKVYTYSFVSENSHFEFSKPFNGINAWLEKKYLETASDNARNDLEKYMSINQCPHCNGQRLNETALSTKIAKHNIIDLSNYSIGELDIFFKKLKLEGEKEIIAAKLLKEIISRISFLQNVGLDYLSLSRPANTLSGGESQRIRLATQIGSALSGVLYVLDEPSIGLHQRDNERLIETLKNLRDLGNTVIVVEHDEDTMMACDYIIDMGPAAGIHGGEVVAAGNLKNFLKSNSLTAQYLTHKKRIPVPTTRVKAKKFIQLTGSKANNIKNISIKIPLEGMTGISGVSGSGKSTLIHKILVPAALNSINKTLITSQVPYKSITGLEDFKGVIELDQSPIGRTPHSNPATYVGIFDEIRTIFSNTTDSQVRGYKPGRFSFNVKGGRCEECEGNGVKKIEMHFLPDVYITCSECNGTRFNRETLSILYKGKNVSEILDMSISDAYEFFKNYTKLSRVLTTLIDVGLGYLKLGQPATTLSGGEAQRLKLSKELSKSTRGKTLYVLDEPTTGLHFEDIKVLLTAIKKLTDNGHPVIVIEHNLDVLKSCDYLIDLGPEGGDGGGSIVAMGTPEDIANCKESHTGRFLKKLVSI